MLHLYFQQQQHRLADLQPVSKRTDRRNWGGLREDMIIIIIFFLFSIGMEASLLFKNKKKSFLLLVFTRGRDQWQVLVTEAFSTRLLVFLKIHVYSLWVFNSILAAFKIISATASSKCRLSGDVKHTQIKRWPLTNQRPEERLNSNSRAVQGGVKCVDPKWVTCKYYIQI